MHRLTFFVLALLGVLLSVHLWIQKERGFDQGCLGVNPSVTAGALTNCTASGLQRGSRLIGFSTAAVGAVFFFVLAVLEYHGATAPKRHARWTDVAITLLLGSALPVPFYLLYLQFAAKAFCPLCLVSTAVQLSLSGLHVARTFLSSGEPRDEEPAGHRALFPTLAFLFCGVLGSVVLFVDRVGMRRLDEGSNTIEFERVLARILPRFIEPETLTAMKPAVFAIGSPSIRVEDWTSDRRTRIVPGGIVPVVAFLDPNCTHCGSAYQALCDVAAEKVETATIHVLPVPLWTRSVLQVQALDLARSEGKYIEMWEEQFKRQKPQGLTFEDIRQICVELHIDTDGLSDRLARHRQEVIKAGIHARDAGVTFSPAIYVGGARVDPTSVNAADISKLIDQVHRLMAERSVAQFPLK